MARGLAAIDLRTADIAPATPQAAEALRAMLKAWAVPQLPLSAPLSVVYGADDTYIDPKWTTDAIAESCAMGGSALLGQLQPGRGHADVDLSHQMRWRADRFANVKVVTGCH